MTAGSTRIGLLILGLVVSGLFISLGNWQLGRATEKSVALTLFENRAASPTIQLDRIDIATLTFKVGHSALTIGTYRPGTTVLLDNQSLGGRIGYLVYTAYRIGETANHILVNRGWIEARADPRRLPEIGPTPTSPMVKGRLSAPPAEGIRLQGAETIEPMGTGIWRVQHINFDSLAKHFGLDLVPVTLLLNNDMPNGFVRNWLPPGADQAKHLGYAFQWFALALALVVISVGLFVRSKKQART